MDQGCFLLHFGRIAPAASSIWVKDIRCSGLAVQIELIPATIKLDHAPTIGVRMAWPVFLTTNSSSVLPWPCGTGEIPLLKSACLGSLTARVITARKNEISIGGVAHQAGTCRFGTDPKGSVSRYPEVTGRKLNVIGVYIAWRGKDLTIPGLEYLTFWSRKGAGGTIASENACLAAISELALAARAPDKEFHQCILMGHSFGGLVLENTISHSILDAGATGSRNSSPWDMALAFNPADNAIGSRQLMSELDYLYKYDPVRHAYVPRAPGAEHADTVPVNRPFLTILQSENDVATGVFFPIGTGVSNVIGLRAHWDRVPVPGSNGQKVSESEWLYAYTGLGEIPGQLPCRAARRNQCSARSKIAGEQGIRSQFQGKSPRLYLLY
jgi:hypothetical protein